MAAPVDATRTLQAVLDAVGSPIRREILWLVWDRELAAGEIAAAFDVSGPTISSHLAALTAAGLVVRRVDGNFRRYRADRDAMEVLIPLLASGHDRWQPADDVPERERADGRIERWVQVAAHAPVAPDEAFADFTDGERYAGWLGVPVSIDDGRFAAELEWGTTVRGHYELVVPPVLVAMRWDFEDEAVPVPGRQLVAYLRVSPTPDGARVEIHQHAPGLEQAEFLLAAWRMVLGRWADHRSRPGTSRAARRPRRPKRTAPGPNGN